MEKQEKDLDIFEEILDGAEKTTPEEKEEVDKEEIEKEEIVNKPKKKEKTDYNKLSLKELIKIYPSLREDRRDKKAQYEKAMSTAKLVREIVKKKASGRRICL